MTKFITKKGKDGSTKRVPIFVERVGRNSKPQSLITTTNFQDEGTEELGLALARVFNRIEGTEEVFRNAVFYLNMSVGDQLESPRERVKWDMEDTWKAILAFESEAYNHMHSAKVLIGDTTTGPDFDSRFEAIKKEITESKNSLSDMLKAMGKINANMEELPESERMMYFSDARLNVERVRGYMLQALTQLADINDLGPVEPEEGIGTDGGEQ